MSDEKFTPNMDKLKADLGPAPPPSFVKAKPEDFAPRRKPPHTETTPFLEAHMAQTIKALLRESPGWDHLTANQREMLDLMMTDVSRIMSGRNFWPELAEHARQGFEE